MDKKDSSRRSFIKSSAAGLGGAVLWGGLPASASNGRPMKGGVFREPAREVPIVEETDVLVAGGGPAGIAAAISAARAGASVRLIEVNGCLGGVWTAGLLSWVFDFDKSGLCEELTRRLDKQGARHGTLQRYVYHVEEMKLLLEDMCREAGVRFQLHTRLVDAYVNDSDRLTTVITESKSGRQAWRAEAFVDATGDGVLGVRAGLAWDYGYKDTDRTQPMTFNGLITVKNVEAIQEYMYLNGYSKATGGLLKEIRRAGLEPSYGNPTLFRLRGDLLCFMVNHEYGVDPFDATQVTEATVSGRAEVQRLANGLRSLGGKWEGIQVVATAEHIGVRSGRRLHGRYTITDSDLIMGARHKDAIARVNFHVDIHAATPEENKKQAIYSDKEILGVESKPYDIPLRALIAEGVDGLMMAGRCISGDFIAHASYRVTGNAVAMGQAAGVTSALAAQRGMFAHEVPFQKVKGTLNDLYGWKVDKGANIKTATTPSSEQ